MRAYTYRELGYTTNMTIPPVNEALIPKYTQQEIARYAQRLQIYGRAVLALCAFALISTVMGGGQNSDSDSAALAVAAGLPVLVGVASGAVLILRGRRLGRTILLIFGWLGALYAAITSFTLPWVFLAGSAEGQGAAIALTWVVLAVASVATLIVLHNPRARIVLR